MTELSAVLIEAKPFISDHHSSTSSLYSLLQSVTGNEHISSSSSSSLLSNTDDAWKNWVGGKEHSGDENEKVKYIIVESRPNNYGAASSSSGLAGRPSMGFGSSGSAPSTSAHALGSISGGPFNAISGPSPFSSSNYEHNTPGSPYSSSASVPFGAGSRPGGKPEPFPQIPAGYHVINVPTSSRPGVPDFCVKNRILCPQHCHQVDMYGCHSCPCAPGKYVGIFNTFNFRLLVRTK